MTDSLKLSEMQRSGMEFERQRHLANWFIKSSPHMATPGASNHQQQPTTVTVAVAAASGLNGNGGVVAGHSGNGAAAGIVSSGNSKNVGPTANGCNNSVAANPPVFYLMGGTNANTGAHNKGSSAVLSHHHMHVEGRKPKLRRFNSHDTSSNMFSVSDFENARLARRNEIEMRQRLQRRVRMSAGNGVSGVYGANGNCGNFNDGDFSTGNSKISKYSNDSQHEPLPADVFFDRYSLPRVVRISYKTNFTNETLQSSSSHDSSTANSSATTNSSISSSIGVSTKNSTTTSPGPNKTTTSNADTGTGTSTSTSASSTNFNKNNTAVTTATTTTTTATNTSSSSGASSSAKHNDSLVVAEVGKKNENQTRNDGELFLLYRLVRQRYIYHGHNAKNSAAQRKKGVLIPQEFPGYFSFINEKNLPTATLYTSLVQLVREQVYKFIAVENMPAYTESQQNLASSPTDGCLSIYTAALGATNNRSQYVKTTARGGQVFRLLAVFEEGKQGQSYLLSNLNSSKLNSNHGREKEKNRYAQLLNDNRQIVYVPLSTKGKFYEIERGIPQLLQNSSAFGGYDPNKKPNPDYVHKITALINNSKELPFTIRYISGASDCNITIPETICITKITPENVVVGCPIEDVEVQNSLHLQKLHITKEMHLVKNCLGFENEQRMFANPNVQNILKYCQFNCDQFLKVIEVEIFNRNERSGSKSRSEGLKILRPLHLPKILRREKTTISAHEKEDSIIFFSKSDLANLEVKEAQNQVATSNNNNNNTNNNSSTNRISDKMKVFQSTKKKWFRKQEKPTSSAAPTTIDLDVQAKRMSMERYSDMSKLLQERFGDKSPNCTNSLEQESNSGASFSSDIACSDTETTTLATIEEKFKKVGKEPVLQKSLSLQDIELISGGGSSHSRFNGYRKPDLLPSPHATITDTISEVGTDLEDLENCIPLQQSFITEKLYNEFHVKTRQYSKSSSSLNQILNFSLPQKLQMHDNKRSLAHIKQRDSAKVEKRYEFNVGGGSAYQPITGRRAAGGLSLLTNGVNSMNDGHGMTSNSNSMIISPSNTITLLEDDLPYSSVRDSLVVSSDESATDNQICGDVNSMHRALHQIDYTKENIYAEICHDSNAFKNAMARESCSFSDEDAHSSQNCDDYGDYASLATTYSTTKSNQNQNQNHVIVTRHGVSRVEVNCQSATSPSPVSYQTVYLGEEPLGERYAERRRTTHNPKTTNELRNSQGSRSSRNSRTSRNSFPMRDQTNITTVELEDNTTARVISINEPGVDDLSETHTDNIYNTLK